MMFNIFYADCTGREGNCLYPHRAEITDKASLAEAVAHDYVCAEYKGSYRSNSNFMGSNCVAVEFDNTHSDDPEKWVYPEDLRAAFPGVPIGIHYSRNHMKEKNGQSPRPKFHTSSGWAVKVSMSFCRLFLPTSMIRPEGAVKRMGFDGGSCFINFRLRFALT